MNEINVIQSLFNKAFDRNKSLNLDDAAMIINATTALAGKLHRLEELEKLQPQKREDKPQRPNTTSTLESSPQTRKRK